MISVEENEVFTLQLDGIVIVVTYTY